MLAAMILEAARRDIASRSRLNSILAASFLSGYRQSVEQMRVVQSLLLERLRNHLRFQGLVQSLAAFRRLSALSSKLSDVAFRSSANCATLVALTMGAVTLGRAINHARATCAGVAECPPATSSNAAKMRKPRSPRRLSIRAPRGLFLKSSLVRYLPVRNPLAKEE